MKTFKTFLAGLVTCSLVLSSFTCVFAEEPPQESGENVQQIEENVDTKAALPDEQESENPDENNQNSELKKEQKNDSKVEPDQLEGTLEVMDSQPEKAVTTLDNTEQPEKLDDVDSTKLKKDDKEDKKQSDESEITKIAALVADPAASTYDEAQTVSLSCETEGASIYYTTDGSEPTEISNLYKEPILIDSSKAIKAKAFLKDFPASETLEAQYVINLDDTKESQSSEVKLPQLTDVSVDNETVTDGGTVTVTATATADGNDNHIVYIHLIFVNKEHPDHYYISSLRNKNNFKEVYQIFKYEQKGTYQLQFVEVGDVYTEQQYCIRNIDSDIKERYIGDLHNNCKELPFDVSFTVDNDIVDTTPPKVKEISFVTPTVTVPNSVKISATITDDFSGVDSTESISTTVWNKENDKTFGIDLTRVSEGSDIYEGTSDALPTYTSSGTYFIASIEVIDNLGNEQVYSLPDFIYRNKSDQNLPDRVSCRINNDQSDDDAPKVVSISVDKNDIDVSHGANINISLDIKEEQSGIDEAKIYVVRVGDKRSESKFSRRSFGDNESARSGIYTFPFKFDKNDAPGTYQIEWISLSDKNDNFARYSDSYSGRLPLPGNKITFEVKNDNYGTVDSNSEYNERGESNPDIWEDGDVSWNVPGTSDSNKIGNLNITNIYPGSYFYIPLGIDMSSMIDIGEDRRVSLYDLDIKYDNDDTDPFEFHVEKDNYPELIEEVSYVEEKVLRAFNNRTCYLKFKLGNTFESGEKTTTGKITFRALKDYSSTSNNGSTYLKGDSIEINYSIAVSNKLVYNGGNVKIDKPVCMAPDGGILNSLTWENNLAALEFAASSNPEKFNATMTTRPIPEVIDNYSNSKDIFWFYSFTGFPKIPTMSTATLTLGIPWDKYQPHPKSPSDVYIYKINWDNTLTDVTKQFTYSTDGLIKGWFTSTNKPGRYLIAGRDLLYKPSSGSHSSGGHSHHSGGGGGGGGHSGGGGGGGSKGGSSAGGAAANLVKASTVSKNATSAVRSAVSTALKSKVNTATANIKITAGNEISPATVRSILKTINSVNASTNKNGIAVTPNLTLGKLKAGKLESRISFNPMLFTSKTNVKLGVALKDKAATTILSKYYKNKTQMVKFSQKGAFGMPVRVTAKLDLSKLNQQTLRFYAYDRANRTIKRIVEPNYTVDQLGYLHFTTNTGDTVVITDTALIRK